ncbi:DUF6167 family protein [Aeromicrobium sp.]|uniref:DUF6167 family protein n=1 Tax=Aeromicrobium sp. TaxID=1871063 RepID=UPI0019B9B9DB|nr:DUF6167 family protein [Aeromicrobium sp.]MBC7633169.1 hypothetical protein [Aeromicrobium sp.]
MRGRVVWFVAGSAAGIYASVKGRRVAYRLSAPGLVDQAAALGLGWRAFTDEMRDGMKTRERDVAASLSGETRPTTTPIDMMSSDEGHH